MTISETDSKLLSQYFKGIPVVRAYLFGSRARNEANEESDIDLLLELDHSSPIGMKFFSYHDDLENLLNKKVDIVTLEGLSPYVLPFIEKDKKLIYERGVA